MNSRNYFLIVSLLFVSPSIAQDIQVYHGRTGETIFFKNTNQQANNILLRKKKGDPFSVKVINANPLFYKYEVKYHEMEAESEDKEIQGILTVFNTILSSRMLPPPADGGVGLAPVIDPLWENYIQAYNTVLGEIKKAKRLIADSDIPELPQQALNYERSGGLRKSIDAVRDLSSDKYKFNSPTLLEDLNEVAGATGQHETIIEALKELNKSLVQKVEDLKKLFRDASSKTVFESTFAVTEKKTNVVLYITRLDTTNNSLVRSYKREVKDTFIIGTIVPYYERAVFELLPVGNFLFASKVKELYLENEVIKSRPESKVSFTPGAVLNINAHRFGETREMSLGFGVGYKLSPNSDFFENFYLSTLFSYKNYFRIGVGLGFSQFPSGLLKSGASIGEKMPSNVDNLSDLIEYEEKPTAFLTISFSGLNLSKKK